jgi:hypothetical protein
MVWEKESGVLHQRRGNGVEALELRWSESERNERVFSVVIQCLYALWCVLC